MSCWEDGNCCWRGKTKGTGCKKLVLAVMLCCNNSLVFCIKSAHPPDGSKQTKARARSQEARACREIYDKLSEISALPLAFHNLLFLFAVEGKQAGYVNKSTTGRRQKGKEEKLGAHNYQAIPRLVSHPIPLDIHIKFPRVRSRGFNGIFLCEPCMR